MRGKWGWLFIVLLNTSLPANAQESRVNVGKFIPTEPIASAPVTDEGDADLPPRPTTPLYPIRDRRSDFWSSQPNNSFDRFTDGSYLRKARIYDPQTKSVIVTENIGPLPYRYPMRYSQQEFTRIETQKNQQAYFQKRAEVAFFTNRKGALPRFSASEQLFNQAFGLNDKIAQVNQFIKDANPLTHIRQRIPPHERLEQLYQQLKLLNQSDSASAQQKQKIQAEIQKIREATIKNLRDRLFSIHPQGFIDFTAGWESFENNIPSIPENLRRTSAPILDMQYDLNLNAQVGTKLQLPLNLSNQNSFSLSNPLSAFGSSLATSTNRLLHSFNNPFQLNQLIRNIHIQYEGSDDQIIRKIEVGGTSFDSEAKLFPNIQNLFGLKATLQFGKLSVTSVLSLQLSQTKTITLQNGGIASAVRLKASDYEENRNFFLAHYFRDHFNENMRALPAVPSQAQILRVEVWVTNRNRSANNAREVIALADLGECSPNQVNPTAAGACATDPFPHNQTNQLYERLRQNAAIRQSQNASSAMQALGLQQGRDYEKFYAYQLPPTSFSFHPFVGYVMIYESISAEFAVSVAYEYVVDGKHYQVGEFSNQLGTNSVGNPHLLLTKLLKPIFPEPQNPVWKLMMKNVYSLGIGGVKKDGFDIKVYYEQPGSVNNVFLPFAQPPYHKNILSLIQADRLNNNNDQQSDGIFDFIENQTVFADRGKLVFPVLEPFGRDLEYVLPPNERSKYIFYSLYDSIKIHAQLRPELDRFYIQGHVKNTEGNQVFLGVANIAPGSIRVLQGALPLREGIDYTVDNNIGLLTIVNPMLINAKLPLTVYFEDNTTGGLQQKSFWGVKADYQLLRDFKVGARFTRYAENPFNLKTLAQQDPVSNIVYGLNTTYRRKFPALSYALDKLLPFYVTDVMSHVKLYGEIASMVPGSSPLIGKNQHATVYLDDFETSNANIHLSLSPVTTWTFASTPLQAHSAQNTVLYEEASRSNDLSYGYNRAKIAWYQIEPNLQNPNLPTNPARHTDLTDHRWRQINTAELFPSASVDIGQGLLRTFDIFFSPTQRGPYNFDTKIDANGNLQDPKKRWGGIMTSFQDQSDFETRNVQFIEFWLQDPFVYGQNPEGGYVYFNLGNISEDILKDGSRMYENGLPTNTQSTETQLSVWGKTPSNTYAISNAFTNDASERLLQDLGLDGLNDAEERAHFSPFLSSMRGQLSAGSNALNALIEDPASDNFLSYRSPTFSTNATILERYANYNNPQGNSANTPLDAVLTIPKITPDQEDINNDNFMNESEDYFEYRVRLQPNMDIGDANGFIVDRRTIQTNNARQSQVNWYLFRIPLHAYVGKVGNIQDFKSIRFMRMFLTGFAEDVVLRMTHFSLVAPSWRPFPHALNHTGQQTNPANTNTHFLVSPINIEQNDRRFPIPYALPPGIERIQQTTLTSASIFLNEQALSLRVDNLSHQDTRAVYKLFNQNLVQYAKMDMFIHVEGTKSGGGGHLQTADVSAVVRIGNDLTHNYYEIELPLQPTNPKSFYTREDIWPSTNNLNLDLRLLPLVKLRRDKAAVSANPQSYTERINARTYTVVGNPSLSRVNVVLIALKNTSNADIDAEMWINELRLSDLNQEVSYAGYASAEFTLADLGTLAVTSSFRTPGFGGIEQKVGERHRDHFTNLGVTSSLELGKVAPDNVHITIPFYMNYTYSRSDPQFDQHAADILTRDKVSVVSNQGQIDSLRFVNAEITRSQVYSVSGVRLLAQPDRPLRFWSPSLWAVSYSYTNVGKTSAEQRQYEFENQYFSLVYHYDPQPKYITPFRRSIRRKSLRFIKQLNVNFVWSNVQMETNIQRSYTFSQPRNIFQARTTVSPYFTKIFFMERSYRFNWNFTRSISMRYQARNMSHIDEPDGKLDSRDKRMQVLRKLFSGGRNVQFDQTIDWRYDLPSQLIPSLSWVRARVQYQVDYRWVSASTSALGIGHTVFNNQKKNVSTDLDFRQLFSRIRVSGHQPKALSWRSLLLITWLDNLQLSYSERASTTLHGLFAKPQILGQDFVTHLPGVSFILGRQFDSKDLDNFARHNHLSTDRSANNQLLQIYERAFRASATLTPLTFFNIQFDVDYTFGKNYTELFELSRQTNRFEHLNGYSSGRFEMSYWGLRTLFDTYDSHSLTQSFQAFLRNRHVVSERVGKTNPNATPRTDGFYSGYNDISQDVLVSSFLAAYTGQSPNHIPLINYDQNLRVNPFSDFLPMPSWKASFSGLSHLPGVKNLFSQILLSNGYTGMLQSNAIGSNPTYEQLLDLTGVPVFIDQITGNFVPYYRITNITITDRFDPLIGIDVVTHTNLTFGFRYTQDRTVSLSMADFQVSENFREGFNANFAQKFKGPHLFRRIVEETIQNNITVRLNMNFSRDYNYNIRLGQTHKTVTGGNRILTILPTIEYAISRNMLLRLFYEYRSNQTNLNLLRNTNQRGGITFRLTFGK